MPVYEDAEEEDDGVVGALEAESERGQEPGKHLLDPGM